MADTYTPINTALLTTSTNIVTFSSIPQTYTDLVLLCRMAATSPGTNAFKVEFNGSTATTLFSQTNLYSNGAAGSSAREVNETNTRFLTSVNPGPSGTEYIHIQNYSNTNTFKSIMSLGGDVGYGVEFNNNSWRSYAQLTSMSIYFSSPTGNAMLAGSRFTLYGIKAA